MEVIPPQIEEHTTNGSEKNSIAGVANDPETPLFVGSDSNATVQVDDLVSEPSLAVPASASSEDKLNSQKETPSKIHRKLRKDEIKEGITSEDVRSAESLRVVSVKSGFLSKRSDQGYIKNWKKRWVVLTSNLLYYFESDTSEKPQGIIQLENATVQLSEAKKFKNLEVVAIKTKADRVFYFYGSAAENREWECAIASIPSVKVANPSTDLESSSVALADSVIEGSSSSGFSVVSEVETEKESLVRAQIEEKDSIIAELRSKIQLLEESSNAAAELHGADDNQLRQVLMETQNEVAELRVTLQHARSNAEEACRTRDSRINQLTLELSQASARAESAATDAAKELIKRSRLENELVELKAELKLYQSRAEEINLAERKAAFQTDELIKARGEALNLRDENERLKKSLEGLRLEKSEFERRLSEVVGSKDLALDQSVAAQKECARLTAELQSALQKLSELQGI